MSLPIENQDCYCNHFQSKRSSNLHQSFRAPDRYNLVLYLFLGHVKLYNKGFTMLLLSYYSYRMTPFLYQEVPNRPDKLNIFDKYDASFPVLYFVLFLIQSNRALY